MNYYEIFSLIFQAITAFAFVFAAKQIKINSKQLNLSVIEKCIRDFRSLEIINSDSIEKPTAIKYLDLVNEELFYMQRGYLPKDICIEWLDGSLDFMALINNKGEIINSKHCLSVFHESTLSCFKQFPRLRNVYTVKNNYKIDLAYSNDLSKERQIERRKIIYELLENLSKFKY